MAVHPRVLAYLNGKGGVGKTSTAANVGGLLAAAQHRILMVDLDPQGNLALDLGYKHKGLSDLGRGLLAAAVTGAKPPVLREIRPNLDVIPGGKYLADLAAVLQSAGGRGEDRGTQYKDFATSIATVATDYDFVFIDCPPGERTLQEAALAVSKWVIVPVKTDDGSSGGLETVADNFERSFAINPDLQLLGVVLWGVNQRAHLVLREARDDLTAILGSTDLVFSTTIRHVEKPARDARKRGQLAHEMERDVASAPAATRPAESAAGLAEDYHRLAQEIVQRLVTAENAAQGAAG